MAISATQLADGLVRAVSKDPKKEKLVVENFLTYLEEKHLMGLLLNVVKHLKRKEHEARLKKSVQITVARELDKLVIERIKQFVGASKDTEVIITLDESVKGGFVAQYKNKIFDGTVKNQLSKAEQLLTQSN